MKVPMKDTVVYDLVCGEELVAVSDADTMLTKSGDLDTVIEYQVYQVTESGDTTRVGKYFAILTELVQSNLSGCYWVQAENKNQQYWEKA